jgi:hypothetical protein
VLDHAELFRTAAPRLWSAIYAYSGGSRTIADDVVAEEQPAAIAVVPESVSSDGTCAGVDAHYLGPLLQTSDSSFSPLPDGWDGNLSLWRTRFDEALQAFPDGGFTACPADPQGAVDAWTRALADNGFTSWHVVDDADQNAQCTSFDVNYDEMIVRVHDPSPAA